MQVTVKAHFNKQTKDSKKELVQFYVKGDDERKPAISELCREIVELKIDGVDAIITAEYVKNSKDSKKTVLDFVVKGDTSATQTYEFYKRAGTDVDLTITESQMSIEEFEEAREGVRGRINADGTAEVDDNQMTLDDIEDDEKLPFEPEGEDEDE